MRARGLGVLTACAALSLALAGCTNTPPPPLVTTNVASTKPAPKPQTQQVVVGLNSVSGGYNPHTLADRSTVTSALSSLLLPSVFRQAPDGTPELDRSVVASAAVTSAVPFTVTYTVRTDASWSDGVPIAAEDFVYLRDAMATQPGVIDPGGYRLISDISARANGKVVQVTFSKPYPGWRSLFTDLLPAHLLKDAPGGWQNALAGSFPAVAGPFAVRSLDTARGEIVLERNDRYWADPALPDQVVLRKAPVDDVVKGLRTGDVQLASLAASAQVMTALHNLGDRVTVTPVARPNVVQLLLRPSGPALGDQRVRRAVAAAIDRNALIHDGLSMAAGSLRDDSLVLAPSQAGYHATMPSDAPGAAPRPATVRSQLAAAGYHHSDAGWSKAGKPLQLRIAAPQGAQPYDALAQQLARQLTAAGIKASVSTPPAAQLYGTLLAAHGGDQGIGKGSAAHGIDIVVAPRPVTSDPTATLAAEFGCPEAGARQPVPPNPSGFCDPALQPTITAALTGDLARSEALAALAPALWSQAVVIPLFQQADEVVVGKDMTGVAHSAPLVAPFPSAPEWRRSGIR